VRVRSFMTLSTMLALTAAALFATGCEEDAPAEEAFSTESLKGQDLVSCWSSKDPLSTSSMQIVCRLVGDGPLKITSASVHDSGGWGASLTPEEPERVVYSSNTLTNKAMTVKVAIDASGVAGLASFVHEAEIKFASNTDHPAEKPTTVVAPFGTWRVSLIGEEVGLTGAKLDPYQIKLGSREVDVKPTFPDVAVSLEDRGRSGTWLQSARAEPRRLRRSLR
jgi:hypothetical protein